MSLGALGVFGGKLPGYLAKSNNHPSKVGLIILQEWWGLNENMKRMADKYASASFTSLVPDLYRGKVATSADEASHLMADMNWDVAVEDVGIAAAHLRQEGCSKIAVMGFCMGGALTIAASCKTSLDAGICFYGIPPKTVADPQNVKCPLQLHFGDNDDSIGFSDKKSADELEGMLRETGKEFTFYRYPTGHAFMNADRPEAFHAESSELAFTRSVNFLNSLQ